jgi:hypothetical protein
MESSGSSISDSDSISSRCTLSESTFLKSVASAESFLNNTMESATTLIENFSGLEELYKVCSPTDPHFKSLWEAAGLPVGKVFFGDFVKCVTAHTLENFDEPARTSIRNAGGWFAYLLKFLV